MSDIAIFACALFFTLGFAAAKILEIVIARRRIQGRLRTYWAQHLRGPRTLIKLIQQR